MGNGGGVAGTGVEIGTVISEARSGSFISVSGILISSLLSSVSRLGLESGDDEEEEEEADLPTQN